MRKMLLCLILLSALSLHAFSQIRQLSGKVTDDKGTPVSGASVVEKKSGKGVSTSADGNFSIAAPAGSILIISYVGFEKREVSVTTAGSLAVSLKPLTGALNEVVVTALGRTVSKAKTGYSTATFNSSEINKNAAIAPLDGLEGKVAGAEISNIGGPGGSTKVILRGYGVISGGNNQPLYVIDGVPFADPMAGSNADPLAGGTDFGNGMTYVNPNDIETITILKGTAASSLYGSLARNGAVMITTKKGRSGKLKVEYDGSADVSKVGKLPDYQNEFGQGWAGQFNLDENGSWGPRLDGKQRLWGSVVDNSQLLKPFSVIKNNLRHFYENGTDVSNNLSLSGGNETNRFYFSYSNAFSNGVVPTKSDYLQRHTFSLRTNSNFGNFSINTSFNYVNRDLNVPNTGQTNAGRGGGVFQSLLQIPVDLPIADFKNYTNKFFDVDNYFTPYAENPYYGLNENGDNQQSDRFFGNLDMSYNFSKAFSVEYRLGGDFLNARTKGWNQPNAPAPGSWRAGANPEKQPANPDAGSFTQGSDYNGIINMDVFLKYNKELVKKLNIDVLAGANYNQTSTRSEFATVTPLTIPSFFDLSNSPNRPIASDVTTLARNMGIYAQATIGYDEQLFLTLNARNDWSSTLPTSNDHLFYPGANLSWLASNTLGFSNTGVLSYLKLRVAYGKTGAVPQPYQVYGELVPGGVALPYGSLSSPFNGTSAFSISNTINNTHLQPIITNEAEAGFEARFFGGRIGIDADYYDKTTKGQIFSVPIAASTGYTTLVENLGEINNKGVELTLNVKPVDSKDFKWSFTYVFSKNINKVENLYGSQDQHPLINGVTSGSSDVEERAVLGKSVASIYATTAALSPTGQIIVNPVTGYPQQNAAALDQFGNPDKYFGNGLYNYTMGLSNTFTYKNFQLSASLDFRYGGVMYSSTADLVIFDGNSSVTTYNDRKPFIIPNSVVAATDAGGHPVYTPNTTYIGNTSPYNGESDYTFAYYYTGNNPSSMGMRIFDRSFLKLRDVNLSYTFPAAVAKKVSASSLSIGLYGKNFLLWTPAANKFVDPEATNFGNDLAGQLGEFSTTPVSKQFGIILKAVF